MIPLLLILLAAEAPAVTAGPDLAEQAVPVVAPIDEVTVYSDRARVRRRARVALTAGTQALRLPDLPGAVLLDTIRIECPEAHLLRVEALPLERERFSIEQVEGLLERLEGLSDAYTAKLGERAALQAELDFLAQVLPRAPVAEAKRVGQPLPALALDAFARVQDFLQARRDSIRATVRELDEQRRKLGEQLAQVQREVGRHDLGAFSDRRVQVLAIVQAPQATEAKLILEYFVPGARWKPSYDLTYLAVGQRVELRTAGQVSQATGEDWAGVALHLSTAIPGQGIDLPELLTWALGERKEFLPQAVASRMPAEAPRFAPPVSRMTAAESDRQARLEVLQKRLAELQGLTERPLPAAHSGRLEELDRQVAELKQNVYRSKARIQLTHESVLAGATEVAVELDEEKPADLTRDRVRVLSRKAPSRKGRQAVRGKMGGSGGGKMTQSVSVADGWADEAEESGDADSSPGAVERVAFTSLGLFDQDFQPGPQFTDPDLPAVAAGGLDYVYTCPTRMSIPSIGEQIAVPLSVDSYPAEVFYEATVSLKETAYLKAKVQNKGERPILAGAVNIFMGPDFAGQGRLQTTGPGGELPLPLGADENIRLKRTVVPKTVTKGVFSKDEITSYLVTIEVGNYKQRAIQIAIHDQIPKSGHEKIEIEAGSIGPKAAKGPDDDGILRWELSIPAGQTAKIEFSYKIERPENWQLHQ